MTNVKIMKVEDAKIPTIDLFGQFLWFYENN